MIPISRQFGKQVSCPRIPTPQYMRYIPYPNTSIVDVWFAIAI